ncbi:hypothetical protein BU14_0196s0024 [Porphyra umbilicalis]|uniref:Uncharacterized protein n=1 Tax=Porphyra umbilicalis TaxID=2786 RepID=A0A1X6P690_PORUM|nr:hypothetical protein BU14_0196s0024 [Porphyra umbilicalis]|eukprot:OSX76357.1 hypothetical protein BU14_0196s0024 [Porphyra umbilicalis]
MSATRSAGGRCQGTNCAAWRVCLGGRRRAAWRQRARPPPPPDAAFPLCTVGVCRRFPPRASWGLPGPRTPAAWRRHVPAARAAPLPSPPARVCQRCARAVAAGIKGRRGGGAGRLPLPLHISTVRRSTESDDAPAVVGR